MRHVLLSSLVIATLLAIAPLANAEEWIELPGSGGAQSNTQSPSDAFHQATQLVNQGQFEEAIREFKTAIESDPGNTEAYYRLALLYQRMRRWGDAATTAEKAFRLDGRNPEIQALWGHALLREGRYPETIWVLEGLLRLNSGASMHEVYYDLAEACYAMKWYQRSVDYALRHLQEGETPEGHALLARSYLAMGYKDKAMGELQKAVSLYESVDDQLR
ncbi:MAG TPA: tetratricopeptide repeat protein [Oscillatoriaceae cyanobacterium]